MTRSVPDQAPRHPAARLLRELIGAELRRVRHDQGRTLDEVSRAAAVSLGYLSEVERGRKEVSSEVLAALCAALGLTLAELLRAVWAGATPAVADRSVLTPARVVRLAGRAGPGAPHLSAA